MRTPRLISKKSIGDGLRTLTLTYSSASWHSHPGIRWRVSPPPASIVLQLSVAIGAWILLAQKH